MSVLTLSFPRMLLTTVTIIGLGVSVPSLAAADEADGYPYPVETFTFDSQRQELSMAYMNVPAAPGSSDEDAEVVVLLHGKNFNGAYWEQTIAFLTEHGYRVVVPDQVGFGQSSLPERYQFTFDQLAANTKALLEHLDVDEITLMGHSMGGMLATRFALRYPNMTDHLLLMNPIGLEDWRAMGVPFVDVAKLYESEQGKNFEGIKSYQQASYYDGEWRDSYTPWAQMLADQYEGERGDAFAWNMALTSDMVLSQPVIHELENLSVPTTLLIGTRDRTAIGRNLVDDATAERMGDYTQLGKQAAERIPDATLVEFDDVGHMPHIEAPDRYLKALAEQLQIDSE